MLIGNGTVLSMNPAKLLYGAHQLNSIVFPSTVVRDGKSAAFGVLASVPSGYRHPGAWAMARTNGGMSSHKEAEVLLAGEADGAKGFNLDATAEISIDAAAIGQLIVSAAGITEISLDANGDIVATLGASGTADVALAGTLVKGALGWLDSTALLELSATLVSYATGNMEGTTEVTTELTPASIAAAVHAYTVEGSLSFAEVQRILLAINVGITVIDPGPPVVVKFRNLADTVDRVTAEMDGSERVEITLNPD
jgi:hypothetical protein